MSFSELAKTGAYVIASLGGGGVILFGLSSFWGKIWADRALETLRQEHAQLNLQLSNHLALLTEERKHLLALKASEHQIRFSKLYENRARVISVLDRRLYELEVLGQRYVQQVGRDGEAAYVHLERKIIESRSFLDSRQIYLTDELYSPIYKFLAAVQEAVINVNVHTDSGKASHEALRRNSGAVLQAFEIVEKQVPSMRHALIQEFRAILSGDLERAL